MTTVHIILNNEFLELICVHILPRVREHFQIRGKTFKVKRIIHDVGSLALPHYPEIRIELE